MKKFFAGTVAALAAVLFLSGSVGAISAQKAILMDGITGQVLYEKQADSKSLIASTTKIMTALIICEECNVLDLVEIPPQAVGIEGSSVYLQAGEILSVQELLYAMMLHSGNDAATALAIYCGGSVENFAAMMNQKAKQLKLNGTHFVNPHGLDAVDHYSTARDLAILARYAMKNPIFAQTVSTKTVKIGNRVLTNHNKLLWRVDGAEGVKTGYTRAAGRILVSSAQKNGRRLVAVTIEDGNDWLDHAALYEQGFQRFGLQKILSKGQVVGTLSVLGGDEEKIAVRALEDFYFPLAIGEKITMSLSKKGMVFAPTVEGADAGFVYISLEGNVVGKVALEYAHTVEQQAKVERKHFWQRLFGE